jgi:cis-L-3-hydroxyproline dehydratase
VVKMAELLDVDEFLDVTQAHIDGCGLMSDASLDFAETMANKGAKVAVPTTLNMIPLDLRNWQKQGVPEEFAQKALRMAQAYIDMGCIPTWTCAPYQGYLLPRLNQQIAWGESNAIAYANSVLGARTNRYADFFDLCAAITGRVPKYGLHLKDNRKGQILFRLVDIPVEILTEPSFFPTLGYLIGQIAEEKIPVIDGLQDISISSDQFKAFGAAAASSGAVGLFHIIGQTPEAESLSQAFQGMEPEKQVCISADDIQAARRGLSTTSERGMKLKAVVLGCPHFSYLEFQQLAQIIDECPRPLHPDVRFLVLTNQTTYGLLERSDLLQKVQNFGAELFFDTCVFHSPLMDVEKGVVMTNSGKCAYYAPGELNTSVVFASMEECLLSAVEGIVITQEKPWNCF